MLIPLAAAAFLSVGRHPLAGLAVGFASVAAAFLVNVLIVPVDGILTEITNDAIRLVNPNRSIDLAANVWFSIGSVAAADRADRPDHRAGDRAAARRLRRATTGRAGENVLSEAEYARPALRAVRLLGVLAFIGLLLLPPGAPLRNPETGAIISDSPFMNSLIVSIALVFLVCGIAYGRGAGTLKTRTRSIGAMQKAIGCLAGLILLLLVISQFIAFFNYTQHGDAGRGRRWPTCCSAPTCDALWLLIGFVVVIFVLDLIITAAIAKWAIFAPVFVPLLMQLGVEPEAVLAAYRVGDSPMNAITPLNAYFAMIVTFAIKLPEGCRRRHGDRADAALRGGALHRLAPALRHLVPGRPTLGAVRA